jgi:hypothetical protein
MLPQVSIDIHQENEYNLRYSIQKFPKEKRLFYLILLEKKIYMKSIKNSIT